MNMMKNNVFGSWSLEKLEQDNSFDIDPFVLLQDSYSKYGGVYANLISAIAKGIEKWMGVHFKDEAIREEVLEAREALALLRHTRWVGELNVLLAVLITKQNNIAPWIIKRTHDRESLHHWQFAVAELWDTGTTWGIVLCRLLDRLNTRLQALVQERELTKQYFVLSMITLRQLQELLANVRRLMLQNQIITGDTFQDYLHQESLVQGLNQLEKAWQSSTFCDEKERNAIVSHIGQLQHWLASIQQSSVSQHAYRSHQQPTLNKKIFKKKKRLKKGYLK